MPITFAIPPVAIMAALEDAMPRLGRSAAIEARSPAISRAANAFGPGAQLRIPRTLRHVLSADAIAMPVYVLGLDQLARGNIVRGAKLALWSHILPSEAGPVSAEVNAVTTRFAQVSESRATARLRTRITTMASTDEDGDDDHQVAQLRIPALHVTLLWLKSEQGRDVFEPVEVTGTVLRVGQRYSEAELAAALRGAAAGRAADDTDG
jgi:hypothetical protein